MSIKFLEETELKVERNHPHSKRQDVQSLYTDVRFWIACILLMAFLVYVLTLYPNS